MLFLFRLNLDTATVEEDNGGWIWRFITDGSKEREEDEIIYIVMAAVQMGILE